MSSVSKAFSFEVLAGPRVRIRGVDRAPSGSPAILHLAAVSPTFDAPGAALALAERGLSLRAARQAVTRLFDEGCAVVSLPSVEDPKAAAYALAACGVVADPYGSPDRVDVRAIRDRSGLSQETFALVFGLDPASVRNWEQGRSVPDTATRSFLLMIRDHPETVRDTLRDHGRRQAAE